MKPDLGKKEEALKVRASFLLDKKNHRKSTERLVNNETARNYTFEQK